MKTILIVEDSNTSRDITCHVLQQGGFRVLEAEDGADALNILKARHAEWVAKNAARLTGQALQQQARLFDMIVDMGQACIAALMPNNSLKQVKSWADNVASNWGISLIWPETQPKEAINVGYECATISGNGDALAILDKHLASFNRKW